MLQCFFGLVHFSAVLLFVTLTGTRAECPIKINPPRLVVRYGGTASADCNSSVPHDGMGWEASVGAVPMTRNNLITWRVSNLTDWKIEPPFCFINYNNDKQCQLDLPITVYQTPDRVSIMTVYHTGPMTEGKQYELQCDVHNVAPVQNLIIRWYKGSTLVDQTTFTETIKTPVSKTTTLLISPDRDDDGDQYRCEAELELGKEGPQPPPKVTSDPLSLEVYYKPQFVSSVETISQNDEVMLNCTVMANPSPTYSWHSKHLKEKISSSVLQSSKLSPGNYTCTATNPLGKDSKVFIVTSTGRTTFWAIVISGVAVAVVLIVSYAIFKIKCAKNSVI